MWIAGSMKNMQSSCTDQPCMSLWRLIGLGKDQVFVTCEAWNNLRLVFTWKSMKSISTVHTIGPCWTQQTIPKYGPISEDSSSRLKWASLPILHMNQVPCTACTTWSGLWKQTSLWGACGDSLTTQTLIKSLTSIYLSTWLSRRRQHGSLTPLPMINSTSPFLTTGKLSWNKGLSLRCSISRCYLGSFARMRNMVTSGVITRPYLLLAFQRTCKVILCTWICGMRGIHLLARRFDGTGIQCAHHKVTLLFK